MFRCDFCGFSSDSPKAKFCANCGPNGPATKWKADQVNQEANISRFSNLYGSVFTNAPKDSKNQILELRRKLKISFDVWKEIEGHYATYSTSTDRDWPISLRYGFAEKEAFAGQDALIEFEVENLTDKHFFKVGIEWDDPGTFRVDLKAISDQYVPPSSTTNLSASVVFDRSGPKQIKGTTISIVDEAGEKRVYAVEAIRISIQNPSLSIQNTVNNTNSISIQGRGVVDAQGLGGQKSAEATSDQQNEITWAALALSPLIDHEELARAITGRLKQNKEKIYKPDPVATNDEPLLNAQNLTDETLDKEDQHSAAQLNALQAVSLSMVQNDHFTTSLVLNVPASTALQDASLEMHIERGDKVTSKTSALTLTVGEHRREFLCLEDGIAVFTSQFVQFNGDTDVEFEFLTILRANPSLIRLECLEEEGLLFLKEKPHNLVVELSELANEIIKGGEQTGTSDPSNSKWVRHLAGTADFGWPRHVAKSDADDYAKIGTATASDFGWELPLILLKRPQCVGTFSQKIKKGEHLVAVGDVAGPWEQSHAFATIIPAATSTEENDEYGRPEEPGSDEQADPTPDVSTGKRRGPSGRAKFFVLLVVGLLAAFIFVQENPNFLPSGSDLGISQSPAPAASLQPLASENRNHTELRGTAIKNARENTTLPFCSGSEFKRQCFGTWNSNGHKYVGEFSDNKREGWGVYSWPNGDFFVGNWFEDRRNGFGTLYRPDGSTREGIWSWNGESYSVD